MEYSYTQSRVGVGGVNGCLTVGSGEGRVMVLDYSRMWPGTFKCSFCDSQFPLSTALLTVSTVHMKLLTTEYLMMKVATL